jgi:hypothetical protein
MKDNMTLGREKVDKLCPYLLLMVSQLDRKRQPYVSCDAFRESENVYRVVLDNIYLSHNV